MQNKLSLALKLLAIYFWSYTPVFVLSLLPQRNTFLGEIFIRDAQVAGYQFELLFAAIFLIWGVYLWKASSKPDNHRFFIDFTIWTSVVHLLWMILMALLQPADTAHLLRDAAVLAIPLGLVVYLRKRKYLGGAI